jgi:uncharacterized membrane protein required for colicin V production
VGQYDVAAAALLLAFGYGGYRRGFVVFVLQLAGGVLAFALAAVLAPVLAPQVAPLVQLPEPLVRPAAVVALSVVLRYVFGFAVRELAAAVRGLLDAIPPLALLDRVLGIVPGVALGGLFVLAVTLALLSLPLGGKAHDAAAGSWLARHVLMEPQAVVATLRHLWDGLVVFPPRLGSLPVSLGVAGLWLGAFAAYRLRGEASERSMREAPTRRIAGPRGATVAAADPLAVPRAALGLAAAGAVMAVLVLLSRAHG